LNVSIETETASPKNTPSQKYGGGKGKGNISPAPGGQKVAGPDPENYVPIPRRYADESKSGLSVTLVAGSQKKDFDLTD
jgi:hypothetical protein